MKPDRLAPWADPESMAAISPAELGPTLVLAPHADDESLGCGGTIARLADLGIEVMVVFVSDGTRSHPNSRRFPAESLRDLREAEARRALEILGGGATIGAEFLRLPDTAVPFPGSDGFDPAVDRLASLIVESGAGTLLIPWRRDPHCDHRASHALGLAAAKGLADSPRVLEYPIWAYAGADPADAPVAGEVVAVRLEIGEVLDRKREAIAAHRSQTTDLIDDDPDGFRLSAEMLAHFDRPWEVFLEQDPAGHREETHR